MAAELLQLSPAFIPEYRHQGKNEVRLIKCLTLAVYADEDFRHLFFVDTGGERKRCKRKSKKILKLDEGILNAFTLGRRHVSTVAEFVQVGIGNLKEARVFCPNSRNVMNERLVLANCGVGNLELSV